MKNPKIFGFLPEKRTERIITTKNTESPKIKMRKGFIIE
jgi:hypothetical protein